MVDIRPLLFLNALAAMLLITAGFAHVKGVTGYAGSELPSVAVTTEEPKLTFPAKPVVESTPAQEPAETSSWKELIAESRAKAEVETSSLSVAPDDDAIFKDEAPKAATVNESLPAAKLPAPQPTPETEPPATQLAVAEPAPIAVPSETTKPVKPQPTTGKLVVRSNVSGDLVLINGKPYGSTKLEVELDPGSYLVEVNKQGFESWTSEIKIGRGDSKTLRARLEHYTRVDFRDGEWKHGIMTGEGSYVGDDGTEYIGEFVKGQFNGKGRIRYPDGSSYSGDWSNGNIQGFGTLITAEGDNYIGQFQNGNFHGEGTLTKKNGDIYTGQWIEGRLNGEGSLTTKAGMLYVGGFSNNQFHGEGTLTYPDGRHYEGSFSNGKYHGKGFETFASGKKYEGQFMEGKYHGKGTILNPNGSKIAGTFKFGAPFGKATLTTPEGEVFTARTSEPGVCYRLKSYRAVSCPPMEGW